MLLLLMSQKCNRSKKFTLRGCIFQHLHITTNIADKHIYFTKLIYHFFYPTKLHINFCVTFCIQLTINAIILVHSSFIRK